MNVLVLNGSPKGDYSVTLQTVRYWEKRYPQHRYTQPRNFYGVGGMKIFRDLIYQMRADHKFYKAHGEYDFPQKKWPQSLLMYAVGAMLASPKIKAKMGGKMNEGMMMGHRKVVDNTLPKQ